MRHYLNLMFVAALFVTSCAKEELAEECFKSPSIVATQENNPNTKTLLSVDEGVGTIYWQPAEDINVFYGTTSVKYTSTNTENVTTAAFETSTIIGSSEGASTNIWGLYPYSSDAVCNGSKVTTTIPSTQYGVPGTFDKNLFTTLAHSTTKELQFLNVCGGIKFSLSRADITKITFEGNNGETLAGKVDLSFVDNVPAATSVTAATKITLTPKTGSTFAKDVNYYIITLPVSMTGGFTMTFETATQIGTFNYTTTAVTVSRSKFSKKENIDTYANFVVDLGLSVKWATCNIGATKPEESGRYFAWGDVAGQTWNGSSWSGDGFWANPLYELDTNNNLKPEYDAAHVLLGGEWRMPTKAEQEELINNCTATWTDNYNGTGVKGRIFTSNKTGYTDRSIFVPAAGYGYDIGLITGGSSGFCWSSTFESPYAWYLTFTSDVVETYYDGRFYGNPIRPVVE